MITLLNHPVRPHSPGITVLLDITRKDIDAPTDEICAFLNEAKAAKRKAGCIFRQFGGDTYFTYTADNQLQLEVSLLAALAVPKADVYVTQDSGSTDKWN